MKKISAILNSPITWKQSFIAAIIGMILSLIYIVMQFGLWNENLKKVSKSFKKAKHK